MKGSGVNRRNKQRGDPKKVIGYVRVSTEDQNLGSRAQRQSFKRWCEANSAELVAVFEDKGVSGGAPIDKRPALLGAVKALRESGAGVLLVAKRDRLARDVIIAALVERLVDRAGAKVLSADGVGEGDGPEAQLMRTLVDAFAQYERALIQARTKAALAARRSQGLRTGQIPFGLRLSEDGEHLEEHPDEQRVINLVGQLRAGGLTIQAITDELNAGDHQARGSRWHPTTIARILDRASE